MLAIIGGTGVYNLSLFDHVEEKLVETPFGECKVILGQVKEKKVVFMTRHGVGHKIPPHQINYRANIYALKSLGVTDIVATTAVGSVDKELAPGTLVFCDQFIDFTKNRVNTFFNGAPLPVVHVDVTEPYCSRLRDIMADCGEVITGGTYVCTQGPRFETPAEIKMFKLLGGDLVGMTGVPEVTLARERAICYNSICIVSNYASGISEDNLTIDEVFEMVKAKESDLLELIYEIIRNLDDDFDCPCRHALNGAEV